MTLLTIDIGGQGIKHAIWKDDKLQDKNTFETPSDWETLKKKMKSVVDQAKLQHDIRGIAMSCPGSVDSQAGIIKGVSAVQYLHGLKIVEAWEELFGLPVSIENDANAAALAELGYGVAKSYQNVAFMIIGTGIGGAIVMNGDLVKGRHLFGGELGYMLLDQQNTLSNLASSRSQISRHNKANPTDLIQNGLELFALAQNGHQAAITIVEEIYDALAQGLYNISLMIDPELLAIGGGISVRPDIVKQLSKRVTYLLEQNGAGDIKPNIQVCHFFNDANLIGAAVHFERTLRQ